MKKITLKKAVFGLVGMGVFSFFGWFFFFKAAYDPNLIIVDKSTISDFSKWEKENESFIYRGSYVAPKKCIKHVAINLDQISTTSGYLVRNWLNNNAKYICFEDSYYYIEKAHVISDVTFQSAIDNEPEKRKISYKYIEDNANVFIRFVNPKIDFSNHGYEGYLNFFKPNIVDVRFVYDMGIPGEGRYSIPFIRSIKEAVLKKMPSIRNEEIIFSFVQVAKPDGKEVIAFRVDAGTNNEFKKYYNFSTDPGKPITYMFY